MGNVVPAAATSKGPLGTDLFLTPDQSRAAAQALGAIRPGTWREAQTRLAWAGLDGLAAVDAALARGELRDSSRIRGYLELALRASIVPDDLAAFPRLRELVAAQLDEGLRLREEAVRDTTLYCRPNSTDAWMRLGELGGFSVPAVLRLLVDSRPAARAGGVELVWRLQVVTQIPTLETMRGDPGAFDMCGFDTIKRSTVGEMVALTLAELRTSVTDQFRYELHLPKTYNAMLSKGLREYAKTLSATTWDGWWDAARPAWNAWWDLAGEPSDSVGVANWTRALQESEGWRLERQRTDSNAMSLRIDGPRSIHCEVDYAERPLHNGPPPVRLTKALKRAFDKGLGPESYKGDLRVVATWPTGWRLERRFFVRGGVKLRITLLDEPRPLR